MIYGPGTRESNRAKYSIADSLKWNASWFLSGLSQGIYKTNLVFQDRQEFSTFLHWANCSTLKLHISDSYAGTVERTQMLLKLDNIYTFFLLFFVFFFPCVMSTSASCFWLLSGITFLCWCFACCFILRCHFSKSLQLLPNKRILIILFHFGKISNNENKINLKFSLILGRCWWGLLLGGGLFFFMYLCKKKWVYLFTSVSI